MANTEILDTLKLVRDAKNSVNEEIDNENSKAKPDPVRQKDLEDSRNCLEDIEADLIAGALDEKIAELKGYKAELDDVNKQIQQDVSDLKDLSDKLGKAASALGFLVDVITSSSALKAL